jgi:hypothetical protein
MTDKSGERTADPVAFSTRIAGDLPDRDYTAIDRYRDFRRLFETDEKGRRVLAQILTRCQLWERSYVAGDPHETARREGMRDVGLWIMEIINFEPPHPQPYDDEESMG